MTPVVVWLLVAIFGLLVSVGLPALFMALRGKTVSEAGLMGAGQLLPGTAALAFGAAATLLWKPGPAPPILRVLMGAMAFVLATGAVAVLGDLQADKAIRPILVAYVSERLYLATGITGLACVIFSSWGEER
jgi:hypothetical protein